MSGCCAACGQSGSTGPFLELSTCAVNRCRGCGFVFLDGRRSVASERGLYQIDHFEEGYIRRLDIDKIVAEQLESTESILRRAGHSLDRIPLDAPVLDVGCARGHFLRELSRKTGRTVLTGVDVSPGMVEHGRREFGMDLRCGAVEEVDLLPDHFGLITMFDVLEHLARPRAVLEKLLSRLRPGGWLVLEVPSETTAFRVLARWAFRATRCRLRGPIEQLYHRSHLSYFTKSSLQRILRAAGGEGIAMTTKEAHITRFGSHNYSAAKRAAIRLVCGLDHALGTEAKILACCRRPDR